MLIIDDNIYVNGVSMFSFVSLYSHCADNWINPCPQLPSNEKYLNINTITIDLVPCGTHRIGHIH